MWNYRVCKQKVNGEVLWRLQEVYYRKDGTILGYAEASVDNWESLKDLKGTLKLMQKAFDKPVLTNEDLEDPRFTISKCP